jgi:nitrite reductase (NADH) large subunit
MKIIIVGNNVAGITAAKAIRALSKDAEITVFSEEPYDYYARPMLIEFIAGAIPEEKLFLEKPDWHANSRIDLRLSTRVERIDTAKKSVLAGGVWHPYDRLVLANGASPFVPPVPGLPKRWAMALRTLDDARRIKERARDLKSAVIIGGGLLGLETANALRRAKPGVSVHILELGGYLLPRQLDKEAGGMLQRMMMDWGIDLHPNAEVLEIGGSEDEMVVRLKNGEAIGAQLVVISAGVRPNMALAKEAGLQIGRGITVDSWMRCPSSDGIFAVGDSAEFDGKVWGIIPTALDQAKLAAKTVLGIEAPPYKDMPPSNSLKVMGVDLTSVGAAAQPPAGSEEIRAMSQDGNIYKKYVLKDGKLVGAILLGTKKGALAVTKMLKEGADVSDIREKLADVNYVVGQ